MPQIERGDTVKIKSSGQEGEVKAIDKGTAQVSSKGTTVSVAESDLTLVKKGDK